MLFGRAKLPRRLFSKKTAKPEEGKVVEKKHINQAAEKFNKMLKREMMPFLVVSFSLAVVYKNRNEFSALIPRSGLAFD